LPDEGDGSGGGTGGGSGFNYQSNTLYLIKLKFNDLSAYETWIQGKPEIYIDIHSDNTQYQLGQLFSKPKKNEVKNNWKTYNHKFCSLPTDVDRLYAKCYEKDNNITLTVSFSISAAIKILGGIVTISPSIGVKTKFQGNDDDMGTYMILYTDAATGKYSNSNLEMYFKH
ncbi:MAG: hypothetical protein L3J74_16210, partial [Bacteroidales bacterium]|nr:hypothetical protein [Bacteroidales bacterium]